MVFSPSLAKSVLPREKTYATDVGDCSNNNALQLAQGASPIILPYLENIFAKTGQEPTRLLGFLQQPHNIFLEFLELNPNFMKPVKTHVSC